MRKKTPNLQHQNLREQKKTNLQHQNLREKKNRQIYNIKIYVRKKNRQIYNIKIYVRKKTAKFKTSKFAWKKKPRNSQHHLQHWGRHWTCAKTLIEAGAWTNICIYIYMYRWNLDGAGIQECLQEWVYHRWGCVGFVLVLRCFQNTSVNLCPNRPHKQ